MATYENDLQTPTTFFTHTDHLGTERVETAVNGSSCETITNTAFGDGLNTSGSCDPSELRFTGKQRDWESNLDDFGARFYSSQLGRFMSADWSAVPAPVPYANLSNPQTLNLYVIVSDNPETFADLDGHCQEGETAASVCPEANEGTGGSLGQAAPEKLIEHPTGTGDTQSQTQKVLQKVTVLGHSVSISYASGLSASDRIAASNAIVAAAGLINKNAGSLTAGEKEAIGQVSAVSVVGPHIRLGATPNGMALSVGYIKKSSSAWIGSLFGHEGQHYLNAGKYSGTSLWMDEKSAATTQLGIGRKIGFTANETAYLEKYMKNRAAMQRHMEQGYIY